MQDTESSLVESSSEPAAADATAETITASEELPAVDAFIPDKILSLDFFGHPIEPFLAILAVVGALVFVVGLMFNIATELTEEGNWFFFGVGVPTALITFAFVGWPLISTWLGITALVFIFVRARLLYWITLFPALLFVPILGLIALHFATPKLIHSVALYTIAKWLLVFIPSFLTPTFALWFLKVNPLKYRRWFLAITVPGIVHGVLILSTMWSYSATFAAQSAYSYAAVGIACGLMLIVPIVLMIKRQEVCLRPLATGLTLVVVGGLIMGGSVGAHLGFFAQ
ncbi:MAG: hypothetical protein AAF585_17445 [Verrucomicrobiota bacterium]